MEHRLVRDSVAALGAPAAGFPAPLGGVWGFGPNGASMGHPEEPAIRPS